jgi:hypothetical protein
MTLLSMIQSLRAKKLNKTETMIQSATYDNDIESSEQDPKTEVIPSTQPIVCNGYTDESIEIKFDFKYKGEQVLYISKKTDEPSTENARVFFDSSDEFLMEYFDLVTEKFFTTSKQLRRDNYLEQDKTIEELYTGNKVKEYLGMDKSDQESIIDSLQRKYRHTLGENSICYIPDNYLLAAYNYICVSSEAKDEYVSMFLKPSTLSEDNLQDFMDFLKDNPEPEVWQALLNKRPFKTLYTEKNGFSKQDLTPDSISDEQSINLSTPGFEGYIGYEKQVKLTKSAINRFLSSNINRFAPTKDQSNKLRVLLYGPPGTGKTHFMNELHRYALQTIEKSFQKDLLKNPDAQKRNLKLFNLVKTDFGSSYYNASENALQKYLDNV